jgi:hypothetical protein
MGACASNGSSAVGLKCYLYSFPQVLNALICDYVGPMRDIIADKVRAAILQYCQNNEALRVYSAYDYDCLTVRRILVYVYNSSSCSASEIAIALNLDRRAFKSWLKHDYPHWTTHNVMRPRVQALLLV